MNRILDYIALDNPGAAISFGDELMQQTQRLAQFPDSGVVAKRTSGRTYRIIVYGNYVIWYYRQGEAVRISKLIHGKRKSK